MDEYDLIVYEMDMDDDAMNHVEPMHYDIHGDEPLSADSNVPDIVAWWSDGEDSRYEV